MPHTYFVSCLLTSGTIVYIEAATGFIVSMSNAMVSALLSSAGYSVLIFPLTLHIIDGPAAVVPSKLFPQ